MRLRERVRREGPASTTPSRTRRRSSSLPATVAARAPSLPRRLTTQLEPDRGGSGWCSRAASVAVATGPARRCRGRSARRGRPRFRPSFRRQRRVGPLRRGAAGGAGRRDGWDVVADRVEPSPEACPFPAEEPKDLLDGERSCSRVLGGLWHGSPWSTQAYERLLKASPPRAEVTGVFACRLPTYVSRHSRGRRWPGNRAPGVVTLLMAVITAAATIWWLTVADVTPQFFGEGLPLTMLTLVFAMLVPT